MLLKFRVNERSTHPDSKQPKQIELLRFWTWQVLAISLTVVSPDDIPTWHLQLLSVISPYSLQPEPSRFFGLFWPPESPCISLIDFLAFLISGVITLSHDSHFAKSEDVRSGFLQGKRQSLFTWVCICMYICIYTYTVYTYIHIYVLQACAEYLSTGLALWSGGWKECFPY